MKQTNRRDFVKFMGLAGAAGAFGPLVWSPRALAASGKVVVVGGGFGGATCASYLTRWGSDIDVTVIEKDSEFVTCPFSNEVIAGDLDIAGITHGYDGLKARGVNMVHYEVTGIDTAGRY